MVMALYAIAEALEARAADRARAAISRLMELAPEQARIDQGSGDWPAGAGGDRGPRRADAGGARRTHSPRWRRGGRQQRRQPSTDHRREPAGGEGPRRSGVRRHDQHPRQPRDHCHGAPTPAAPWRGSSMWWSRPRRRGLRSSGSWIASRGATRRRCSCWPWRWRCSRLRCWA